MIMNKYFMIFIAAIALLAAAMLSSNSNVDIWWGKSKLVETLALGETKTLEVVFSSKEDLGEVTLSTSDDLSNFIVGFQPEKITVAPNQPYKFDLTLKAPSDTPLGSYGGTIHLRQGKRTIAKPLPVNLIIAESQPPQPPPPLSFTWSAPTNISNLSFQSYQPKVLADQLGNVYSIWLNSDYNSQYNIYFTKLENGIWSSPQKIVSNDRYNTIYDFDFDIDNQNHLHLAFTQYLGGTGYAVYYMSFDGTSWSMPQKIANGSDPSIAIGPDAKVHLVYSYSPDIYYIIFNGSSWSTPINVSNDGTLFDDYTKGAKAIRVDNNNNVHIAWSKYNHGIMYTKFDGTNWSTPQLISQLSSWPDIAFWLSLASNDVVGVAYTQGKNDCINQEIYFALSNDNGLTWNSSVLISNADGIGSRWPSIAVVSPINIQLVWSECSTAVPFRFFNGTGWSEIVDISNGTQGAGFPNIFTTQSKTYVVWDYSGEIYFSQSQ